MDRYVNPDGEIEDVDPWLEVVLPYSMGLCFDLWAAWKDHGVMPHSGGYSEQPAEWRRMIRLFNSRYNPIFEDWLAQQRGSESDRKDLTGDLLGEMVANGIGGSWESRPRG